MLGHSFSNSFLFLHIWYTSLGTSYFKVYNKVKMQNQSDPSNFERITGLHSLVIRTQIHMTALKIDMTKLRKFIRPDSVKIYSKKLSKINRKNDVLCKTC